MTTSQARVATDRPHRYAKQLASHLGRKIDGTWDHDNGRGLLTFPFGQATLIAEDGVLHIVVEGESADIEQLEDVVGRHLVRFAAPGELTVTWHRDTGQPGLVHRNDAE
ncbi:MAG: DUF2218 domain-containing protein [Streptomycetaceae bacterium]|nr:DUF2218 domain-containing protein [Streptomycetaceae bacterium]